MENPKQKLFGCVFRNRKLLLLLFASLLLLFIFFREIKAMAVVALLAFMGAFGQVYKRYIRLTSAAEF